MISLLYANKPQQKNTRYYMKTKIPAGINFSNTLDLLAFATAQDFPYDLVEPGAKIKPGETEHGTISHDLTKRLMTLSRWTAETAKAGHDEHRKLHDCPTAIVTPLDCKQSAQKASSLMERASLLQRLMWLSVRNEFPLEAINNVGLREGWKFIGSADSEWIEHTLFPQPKELPNLILGQITGTFTEKPVNVEDSDISVSPKDELGKKIGIIDDPRIKSLYAIERRLSRYTEDMMAIDGVPVDAVDQEILQKWTDAQTIGSLKRHARVYRCLSDLSELLSNIFWRAVRDTLPGAGEADGLILHSGWTVYEDPNAFALSDLIEGALLGSGGQIISGNSELGKAILRIVKLANRDPLVSKS
jgi:hypothetical protein